ncbi:MAG: sel1 repeat family protein [Opitutae bacterium]|nr:sel1 repeat family protein [Opitutae bacterium]
MKVLLLSLALVAPALSAPAEGSFLRYLRETAARDDTESMFVLGLVQRDGWAGKIEPDSLCAKWRDLAAELGDRRPGLLLGLLQREKTPVRPDGAVALTLLERAADQGDNYAEVILGDILLEGDGVPADWRRGLERLRRAAHAGFAPAQFRLGVAFYVGNEALPKDDIESLAWFILAAEAGSAHAAAYRDEQTRALGAKPPASRSGAAGRCSRRTPGPPAKSRPTQNARA